jgi:hypothetical protein
VARAAGVQTEMELAFAGLHQLCAPMLAHVDRLPCRRCTPPPARVTAESAVFRHNSVYD